MSDHLELAEFRHWYVGLDAAARVRGLSGIGTWLTIAARSAYVPGSEEVAHPIILRRANEAQHRVLGQLTALLDEDPMRYSDEAFADILIECFTSIPIDLGAMMRNLKVQA